MQAALPRKVAGLVTVLPGMPVPDPDITKGCKNTCLRGMVERDDGSFYPCPTHNEAAFKRWSEGKYPGWADSATETRRATL